MTKLGIAATFIAGLTAGALGSTVTLSSGRPATLFMRTISFTQTKAEACGVLRTEDGKLESTCWPLATDGGVWADALKQFPKSR